MTPHTWLVLRQCRHQSCARRSAYDVSAGNNNSTQAAVYSPTLQQATLQQATLQWATLQQATLQQATLTPQPWSTSFLTNLCHIILQPARCKIRPQLIGNANRNSYVIHQTVTFPTILSDF